MMYSRGTPVNITYRFLPVSEFRRDTILKIHTVLLLDFYERGYFLIISLYSRFFFPRHNGSEQLDGLAVLLLQNNTIDVQQWY